MTLIAAFFLSSVIALGVGYLTEGFLTMTKVSQDKDAINKIAIGLGTLSLPITFLFLISS